MTILPMGLLPKHKWPRRIAIALYAVISVSLIGMYGVAEWYVHSEQGKPYQTGVTFVPDYAQSLGVNPQANMDALLKMGVKNFRLVGYWSDLEPTPGHYDFSQLDWQFQKAEAAHAKITLSIGLRQPRWPECHAPDWVNTAAPENQWQPQLEQFMKAVVNRYKNSPSLQSYQLENEFFLRGFGTCNNFDRQRFVDEFNLVQQTDPRHPITLSRSNNAIGIPIGAPKPTGDYGISIYRRVWDQSVHTHRYLEYPFPSWYYAFLAGVTKIHDGHDSIIDEMQAEAWAPNGKLVENTSLAEQNKSIDAKRLQGVFKYAKATGMRTTYMWGSEYWYYRLTVLHDPSLWNVAKQKYGQTVAQ